MIVAILSNHYRPVQKRARIPLEGYSGSFNRLNSFQYFPLDVGTTRNGADARSKEAINEQYDLAVAKWLAEFAGAGFGAMVAEHLELAGEIRDAARQYAEASEYARARGADEEAVWLEDHARELAAREKTQ